MTMTRRRFVQGMAGVGVLGIAQNLFPSWMPKMAFAQEGSRSNKDVLVVIFQRGGMDGLNAVVPYGEGSNYYDRRPTIAIAEPNSSDYGAIDIDGFFGFHPSLRPLVDIYNEGQLNIIHASGLTNSTRSHFDAMEYMERGIPGDKMTPTGWISRHLSTASWQNDSPFRAIGMGAIVPTSLRGPQSALALRSIGDFHLQGREDMLVNVQRTLTGLYTVETAGDALGMQANDVFRTMGFLEELSGSDYLPENGAQYPDSGYGMGLSQIAQLIKADVGLEVACVDIGGWDTHDYQGGAEGAMSQLLDEFSRGLAAFYNDLHDQMTNVTVVTMSEFGRTTIENANEGTDHGRASVMFVMGGGATGGMYADWKGLNDEALDEGDLAVTTDYRDVISEILMKRVGNNAVDQIFPNHTFTDHGLIKAL
jgi:uncharacterized protein (DUF1501 family)